MSQVPQGFADWLATQNQADVFPTLIHQLILLVRLFYTNFLNNHLDYAEKGIQPRFLKFDAFSRLNSRIKWMFNFFYFGYIVRQVHNFGDRGMAAYH